MELYTIYFSFVFSITVNLESLVEAIILKPFGNFTTASSWLIHTEFFELKKLFVKIDRFFFTRKALPNSRLFF